MSNVRRLFRLVLIAVAGLVLGVVVVGYGLLRLSVPVTDGTIYLDGINDSIVITFDARGIPQIWADNAHDGYFALGYQHSADRMFQMDLIRRVSQGRLSEMLGNMTVELDKQQRTIGHHRLAANILDSLPEKVRLRLEAYADGVNSYHENCRSLPFEYRFLPVEFEKWTVYDCLTVLSYQTWFSNALMNRDKFARDLYEQLGPDQAQKFLPLYPDWAPVSVPEKNQDNAFNSTPVTYGRYFPTGFELLSTPHRMSNASNAWAIAPHRSQSGSAILASDPHLEINRLPQFWYGAGLHISETNEQTLGITTPGLPYFIMGHNGQAAWAFTVGGVDVIDYYLERLNPEDPTRYLTSSGYESFEIHIDTIFVSGEEPVIVKTKITQHGPIVGDPVDDTTVYALHWVGYDHSLAVAAEAGFDLHRATRFESFQKVVTRFGALDAAWIYADSSGDIGYQLGTPIPQRPHHAIGMPLRGWIDEDNWQSATLPLAETPSAKNPSQGWLASCNNLSTRAIEIPGNYAHERIYRIEQLLTSQERFTPDDMGKFQMDQTDVSLVRWASRLADIMPFVDSNLTRPVQTWDGNTDTGNTVAPLVEIFVDRLIDNYFDDQLGTLSGQVSSDLVDQIYQGYYDSIAYYIEQNREHPIQAIAIKSAREAIKQTSGQTIGQLQTLSMRHPLAIIPFLGDWLDLDHGPWSWSGTSGTLRAAYSFESPEGPSRVVVGPSWRFVIDFANVDSTTFVLPAGNSGNPMSPHFFDFFQDWRDGKTWIVPFSRGVVEQSARSRLTFRPH